MIDDLSKGGNRSEIAENFSNFDGTFDIDRDVERTNILMCDFILLQVLHYTEESLSKIPDFTFFVRKIDFLSLWDFDLQIVIVVFVQ